MTRVATTKHYFIDALELGPMENLIYLITDRETGRTAVVDPAWDAPAILQHANKEGLSISDILLTHSHHDHINGIEAVLARHDAQLHLLKPEAEFWGQQLATPSLHHGGDVIQLGKTEIEVLHTPGHTPGSACYQIHDHLITGDTMFVWGCGRCDLAGGDPEVMYDTLQKLGKMPAATVILPGHNYADRTTSSIGEQVEGNPFMHFDNKEDFVEYRMHLHDRIREEPYHAEPRKKG